LFFFKDITTTSTLFPSINSTITPVTSKLGTNITTTICPAGDWQFWSECDKTCGPGTKIRIRFIVENGTCQYQEEATPCKVNNCTCDITNDIILKFNLSLINNLTKEIGWIEKDGVNGPSSLNESVRVGDSVQSEQLIFLENCQALKCLENGSLDLTIYFENSTLSQWSFWSSCDGICGNGKRNRTRQCITTKCTPPEFSTCKNQSLVEFSDCECPTTTTVKITHTSKQNCILPNNTTISEGESLSLGSPCNVCVCVNGNMDCKILTCNDTEANCLNRSNANEIYEFIPPSDDSCCGKCRVRFNTTCSVIRLEDDFVSLNSSCRSRQRVQREECFGTCYSSHQSFIQNGVITRQCRCCSPTLVSLEDIQVVCSNGRSALLRYTRILSCTCQECLTTPENKRYLIY
jgi:hypothetical protein